MTPIRYLMLEHRLIERMLEIVVREVSSMKDTGEADSAFIDTIVDFFHTYADLTHHGKEEEILFKQMEKKEIPAHERSLMVELLEEHKFGRKAVAALVQAKSEYIAGNLQALKTIIRQLETLAQFYTNHINKEDRFIFPATEKFFTPEEQNSLLKAFGNFDRKIIHEKYIAVYSSLK